MYPPTAWSAIYNALGWRVERTSSAGRSEYVYGAAGTDLGNFNGGNGAWYEQYVPFEGRVLWYYNASGNVSRYFHVNALGSLGLSTNQTGAPVEEMLYYPFGRGWQDSSGNWWDLKFAKMQTEDVDLHMEMTPHRMYNPLLGRWMKADPMGGDVMNPQSLNRYAYVTNNPTTLNDPLGLSGECTTNFQRLTNPNCDPASPCAYTFDAQCSQPPSIWLGGGGGPLPPYDGGGTGGVIGGGGGASGGTSVGGPPMGGGSSGYWSPGCSFPYNSMGLCWTGEAGGELSYTWWGFHLSFFAGLAIDSHGHVALYHGTGFGAGAGAGGSLSLQVGGSNANDVCGLGGPFQNASSMGGLDGVEGTADVFQGKGNGPGGIVTGGGLSAGIGGGGSASTTVTTTKVVPVRGGCGPGGKWVP